MGNENNIFCLNRSYKRSTSIINFGFVKVENSSINKLKKLIKISSPINFSVYNIESNINGYGTTKEIKEIEIPVKTTIKNNDNNNLKLNKSQEFKSNSNNTVGKTLDQNDELKTKLDDSEFSKNEVKSIKRINTKFDLAHGIHKEIKDPIMDIDNTDDSDKCKETKKVKNPNLLNKEKKSEVCYWKLPMNQWPKCKTSRNSAIIELHSEKAKIKTAINEKPQTSIKEKPRTSIKEKPIDSAISHKIFKFITGFSIRSKDDDDGDDACFTCERALGVADGVSGWCTYGISSSAFSQELMQECENEIRSITKLKQGTHNELPIKPISRVISYVGLNFQDNTVYEAATLDTEANTNANESVNSSLAKQQFETKLNPKAILTNSYNRVKDIGSATATIVVLNKDEIDAVNLGDSGFIHLSKKESKYYIKNLSREQQHGFNIPFQLARFPSDLYINKMRKDGRRREAIQLKSLIDNKKLCGDEPETADEYNFQVSENDIILLGTDGVFDNIFSSEILRIVNNCMLNASRITNRVAKEIAERLVAEAYRKSKLLVVDTPFKRKYETSKNENWESGKEDDITIAVGIVKPYHSSQ